MNLNLDYQLKVPVVIRPEYTISLSQVNPEFTQAHCDIKVPWTQGVKRKLMSDWKVFIELRGGNDNPLYATHVPPDYKHHKFLTLVAGMEPYASNGDYIIYKTKD